MKQVPVIIADDDCALLALAGKVVSNAGYVTHTCDNGDAAYELVRQHAPAILVSDWEMPGLDGPELCKKIRESEVSEQIYVLLLTANADPANVVIGFEAGANDYVTKPFIPEVLLARVGAGAGVMRLLHQQAERAAEFERIIEGNPAGIVVLDADSRQIVRANSNVCRLAGCTEAELIGRQYGDFLGDAPAGPSGQSPGSASYDRVFKRRDGTATPVLTNSVRLPLDGVPHVLETITDITQLKEAEAALRKVSEERQQLERIVNQSPAVAFVWAAADGLPIEYVSDNIRQFGYIPEELRVRQTPFGEIIHPDDRQHILDAVAERCHAGKREFVDEHRIITQSGDIRWVEHRSWIRRDANGEVNQLKGLVLDITDRKLAEMQNRRLALAIDSAVEGIVLTDLDGRITRVNPAFSRITGYSAEEAIGQTPGILKSGEQSREFYAAMWSTIRAGKVWSGRVVDRCKDGRHYHAELTISPIPDEHKNVTGFVGVQRNVTQQVKKEQELKRAKAEAEEALKQLEQAHGQLLHADKMASIGQLAAGVAHEINNPIGFVTSNLNSLGDYAETLAGVFAAYDGLLDACIEGSSTVPQRADEVKRLRDQSDTDFIMSDLKDLIAESTDGAKRVKQIVADLRDFSHVDKPDVTEEDIGQLIDRTINVAWNELKHKIEIERDYGELPPVPCYGGKLGQVFLNLLVNAAHAIEERGIVTIRTRHADGVIHIQVADTGGGIPPENLRRIFDPFFTTKDVGAGTGMGLHLSYKIIQAHGGKISAESVVGEGTTFAIELPVTGPPAVQESQHESVA